MAAASSVSKWLLAMDVSFRLVCEEFDNESDARAEAERLWCCWVLYEADRQAVWHEVACGGVGFSHGLVRSRVCARISADGGGQADDVGQESSIDDALLLKAGEVTDPEIQWSLQSAVRSLREAAGIKTTTGVIVEELLPTYQPKSSAEEAEGVVEDGGPTIEPPGASLSSLASSFSAALMASTDGVCEAALIEFVQSLLQGSQGGADELVEALVQLFEACNLPSDAEMARLRAMQACSDAGMGGYAVATLWVAALFARSERCMRARSRLTECVLLMSPRQRTELDGAGSRLAQTELPELLQCIARICEHVQRIERDIGVQEVSVRTAKGISAGMSIAGTALVFTPLVPIGVGLLAGGAGIGVTTATSDAIGQHVQRSDLKERMHEAMTINERSASAPASASPSPSPGSHGRAHDNH